MKVRLTDKKTGYHEYGRFITKTEDNFIVEEDTGSAKLYKIKEWDCDEVRDE